MNASKKKLFREVLSLMEMLVLLLITSMLLGNALTSVTYADYFNRDLKRIEKEKEDVDILFIGDSRVYSSMDGRVFEEKMGLRNVVVAATASQPVNGSYYLIKDLIERLRPKKIILSLDYDLLMEDAKVQPMLLCMDRMSYVNRIQMWRNCFFGADLFYGFDIYRYRENIDDLSDLIQKRKEFEKNGMISDPESNEYYCYKGFIYRDNSCETGTIPVQVKGSFDENDVIESNKEYLDACVSICKENGIELELFSAPTTMMRVYYVENYEGAVEYYRNYAKQNGLVYHNLNYLRNREEILPDEMMFDYNHTNGQGAKVISEIFAQILIEERNGESVDDYFYADFEELSSDITRITGVDAEISTEGDLCQLKLKSTHSKYVTPLYLIEYIDENGNCSVLVDWTAEERIEIPIEKSLNGKLRVSARNSENYDKIAYQVYEINK